MLLVSLTDKLLKQHVEELSKHVYPMKIHLEPDLLRSSLPLDEVEILITYGSDVSKETLDLMPSLKWIQVFQSGVEEIPLQELKDRNILLTNIKGIHGIPMTEYVMSIILYFTRDIPRYNKYKQKRMWYRQEFVDEAHGKTVSIFGAGTVGQFIAQKCKDYGLKVIGVNTSENPKPHFDEMYSIEAKDLVLQKSDFVVLLLPATKETYHCIGKREFELMKKDAYLINIGRGSLVNTDDLITGLQNKAIKGAALDVVEQDPLPENHPLWDVENVIITPHIAARTYQYFDRGIEKFLLNLEAYKKGKKPPFNIDLDKGY